MPDYLDVSSSLGTLIRDEVRDVVDHAVTMPRWLEAFFESFTDLDDEALARSRYEYLMPQYSQIADVESIGTMVLRLGRHLRTYADLYRFSAVGSTQDAPPTEDSGESGGDTSTSTCHGRTSRTPRASK